MVFEISDEALPIIKEIMQLYPSTTGIVIVSINQQNDVEDYFAGDDCFWPFGSETLREDPQTYRSLRMAKRRLQKFVTEHANESWEWFDNHHFTVAFWFHPDFAVEPLQRYIQMTGWQMPGSPTQ